MHRTEIGTVLTAQQEDHHSKFSNPKQHQHHLESAKARIVATKFAKESTSSYALSARLISTNNKDAVK